MSRLQRVLQLVWNWCWTSYSMATNDFGMYSKCFGRKLLDNKSWGDNENGKTSNYKTDFPNLEKIQHFIIFPTFRACHRSLCRGHPSLTCLHSLKTAQTCYSDGNITSTVLRSKFRNFSIIISVKFVGPIYSFPLYTLSLLECASLFRPILLFAFVNHDAYYAANVQKLTLHIKLSHLYASLTH